jgi:hypothetical protein
MFEDQKNLYSRLATNVADENTTSRRPYESIEDLVEADEPIKSVGSISNKQLQNALLFGAQMLPGSDFARETGISKFEQPISKDIKEEKLLDPTLKGISTTGDVMLMTAPFTGPGALGTAAVGATLKYGPKVYSALSKAVKNLKVNKASGQDVFNILSKTKDVSPQEIKFIGLDKFLKDKKSITKEEVNEYVEDSSIPIQEKVYGTDIEYNNKRIEINDKREAIFDSIKNIDDDILEIQKKAGYPTKPAKSYNEQTGETTIRTFEDAEEVIDLDNLSLEQRKKLELKVRPLIENLKKEKDILKKADLEFKEEASKLRNEKKGKEFPAAKYANWTIDSTGGKNYREINFITKPKSGEFKENHYPSDRNIFARVRVADRIDADGKPTLHLEEVQSEYATQTRGAKDVAPVNIKEDRIKLKKEIDNSIKKEIKILGELDTTYQKKYNYLGLQEDYQFLKTKTSELDKRIRNLQATIKNLKGKDSPFMNYKETLKELQERFIFLENKRKGIGKKIVDLQNKMDKELDKNKIFNELQSKRKLNEDKYSKTSFLRGLPPELPYAKKDNWYKFPIRRMIRDAAERDIDSITLTTGNVQFAKYMDETDITFKEAKAELETIDYMKQNVDDLLKNFNINTFSSSKYPKIKMPSLVNKYLKDIKEAIAEVNEMKKSKSPIVLGDRPIKPSDISTKQAIREVNSRYKGVSTARVGIQYDTKFKSYLDDLAKRYNTTVDMTRVDGPIIDNMGYDKSFADRAEAYRLKITPEMKKEILEKGIAKFKIGGYINERI